MRILSFVAICLLLVFSSCTSEDIKTETFKVYGNCGMCKETIESSLEGAKGVESAEWNIKSKMITVEYNPSETDLTKIKRKIANVGYDTDEVRASDDVYSGLPQCCQYDRPE